MKEEDYDFEVTVPVSRQADFKTIFLKDIGWDLYKVANTYIQADKEEEAVKVIINGCRVSGAKWSDFEGNFIAMQSLKSLIKDLIKPIPSLIKKKSLTDESNAK